MKLLISLVILIFVIAKPQEQKLGFGCLGLVGGFAGYSMQNYQPDGLNSLIEDFNTYYKDSIDQKFEKFGKMAGYRFGANFFRQNFSGFVFTVKGFYQSQIEKKSGIIKSKDVPNFNEINEMELKSEQLAIGIDLGTSLSKTIDWKVIDAAFIFFNTKLSRSINRPGENTIYSEYHNESKTFGYSVGSGFIFHLIRNYISIEGEFGYTIFKVDRLIDNEEKSLNYYSKNEEVRDLITNGGFNAVIQINIGFPF